MTKKIFAVETKFGTVTRATDREYTHAIVKDGWPLAFSGSYSLAVKAQRAEAGLEGSEILEVKQIEKQPKDPYKGIKLYHVLYEDVHGRTQWSRAAVDTDGKTYVQANKGWEPFDLATAGNKRELKGYLDRIYSLYYFTRWKNEKGSC